MILRPDILNVGKNLTLMWLCQHQRDRNPLLGRSPLIYPHLEQASHEEGKDLKIAFFVGLSAVPHVHEVHSVNVDVGCTRWTRWETLFATRMSAADLAIGAGGGILGSCPSMDGFQPVLKVARTLCRAIRSETPSALSYTSGIREPLDHLPRRSISSTVHMLRARNCWPNVIRKWRKQ